MILHPEDKKLYNKILSEEIQWYLELYDGGKLRFSDLNKEDQYDIEELVEYRLESELTTSSAELMRKVYAK